MVSTRNKFLLYALPSIGEEEIADRERRIPGHAGYGRGGASGGDCGRPGDGVG